MSAIVTSLWLILCLKLVDIAYAEHWKTFAPCSIASRSRGAGRFDSGWYVHVDVVALTAKRAMHTPCTAFHDDLDFVSVHEALLQEFRSVLEGIRGRQPLDSQIDAIVKVKASGLADRKALTHVRVISFFKTSLETTFVQIFKKFVRNLLQGKTLLIEDAVDVLTLKDNSNSLEDFATALQLLFRIQVSVLGNSWNWWSIFS